MSEFVDAIVKATGEVQAIPADWLEHPILSGPFELAPAPAAAEVPEPVVVDEPEPEPEEEVEPPAPPAESALKDDWIAWAVHVQVAAGATPDEAFEVASAKTKDDLIHDYGNPAA